MNPSRYLHFKAAEQFKLIPILTKLQSFITTEMSRNAYIPLPEHF
jgi:hypothetical protein